MCGMTEPPDGFWQRLVGLHHGNARCSLFLALPLRNQKPPVPRLAHTVLPVASSRVTPWLWLKEHHLPHNTPRKDCAETRAAKKDRKRRIKERKTTREAWEGRMRQPRSLCSKNQRDHHEDHDTAPQAPSLVLKRAVSYLERVKRTFVDRPDVYRTFLALMHAFKEQR